MEIRKIFHTALLTGCLSVCTVPAFAEDTNVTESDWFSQIVILIVLALIAYWLWHKSKKLNAVVTPPPPAPAAAAPHGTVPHGTPPAPPAGGAHPPAAAPHPHHEQNPTRFWSFVILGIVLGFIAIKFACNTALPIADENTKMWSDDKLGTHFTQQAKDKYASHRDEMAQPGYNGRPTIPFDTTVEVQKNGYLIDMEKTHLTEVHCNINTVDGSPFTSKACFGDMKDTVILGQEVHKKPGPCNLYWFGKIPNKITKLHYWGRKEVK
jgi:hypothetical protein